MTSTDGDSVARFGVLDVKPSLDSLFQSDLSICAGMPDEAASLCSVTSSVMGPPTYRPPDRPESTTSVIGERVNRSEDVDARIREIKSKIEIEMKERKHFPPPFVPPTFVPPTFLPPAFLRPSFVVPMTGLSMPHGRSVAMPMEVDGEEQTSPTMKKKNGFRDDVLLDPSSGRVVDIASLPWHQRFALTHPYFQDMPYVPPRLPFVPGGPPFPHPSVTNQRGRPSRPPFRIPFRTAPLVRYIPGGAKDLNRQSSFDPVDFSSELMSYVRMRKEMLKMDLREKIRQRKEDLVRSQRAVLEKNAFRGGRPPLPYKEEFGATECSGKYQSRGELRERERNLSRGRESPPQQRQSSPPPLPSAKTPRQLWQARMRGTKERARSRSSSSSSSSSSTDEKVLDSRRKWITQRKATMLAKTALIKQKIHRAKATSVGKGCGYYERRRRSPSPEIKVKSSPQRAAGRRSPIPRIKQLRV